MFSRISISRCAVLAHAATRSRPLARPMLAAQQIVRFESQKAADDEEKKKFLETLNDVLRDWDAKILGYNDVKPKSLEPSSDFYIIDVREPDEVRLGSIPSSVNLPLSVLAGALHLNPAAFKALYGFDKPKQDQEIIFYCRSGKRSGSACDIAKRNGFKNLANYKGSWLDWVKKEGITPPS
ncbi:Rhodanese-like protein [Sparassis latifolia]|uniref:Thiosulfate sulfurtransferase n=1 Tax=Sparassis crispa TaxID=139825 RepID=A0A401G7K1_9APHY|nr:Putative thiosulfate sulfurtransferase [Sparassis crispa]GBE78146.1 Putative thiosulfate sulfurtransferase [Sparassis crispa]